MSLESASWYRAYRRFETPEQEVRKFHRRLLRAGSREWDRDLGIVDLFCGRGGALRALRRQGFARIVGIDTATEILGEVEAPTAAADCRWLPIAEGGRDVAIVQGGLHHLDVSSNDLDLVLDEIARILAPGGRVVIVEPRRDLFLRFVHVLCGLPALRWMSRRVDALATMIEEEGERYTAWLDQTDSILTLLEDRFDPERVELRWGKLLFVGRA